VGGVVQRPSDNDDNEEVTTTMAKLCPGLLWAILWFIALLVIGWPIGFFVAWFYVLLLPFGACIDAIKEVCESLLKLVKLPLTFAENMVEMKTCGS